jgi:CDP-diacylglycerol---glycerol-3-phosphate 3-phosphatidyltransferase
MAQPSRMNLPNAITVARILACPGVFILALSTVPSHLFAAFLLFLAAAVSDLWDGYLARKHGLITNMGKLLDPLADKLLLVSTLVPFYIVSQAGDPLGHVPWWGPLPLWVVVVILGRELLVTVLRSLAARRGAVIGAGQSGKIKAFVQNVFSGSLLLWYALVRTAAERGWIETGGWRAWALLHETVTALTLAAALLLTVFSLGVYLVQYRAHFRSSGSRGS